MSLSRWNASPRDLATFRDDVDRLFDSVFTVAPVIRNGERFVPPVDIEETEEAFVIRADLPGVPAKDVKVTMIGDTLTIRGERTVEARPDLRRSERVHGAFERSFTLNTPVRADGIEAVYRDGVLEVRVPKAEEAKLKEIPIRIGS